MESGNEASNENVKPKRPNKHGSDLQPAVSSELFWDEEHRRQSLEVVYKRAENHALNAIEWYLHAKRSKKNVLNSFGSEQSHHRPLRVFCRY